MLRCRRTAHHTIDADAEWCDCKDLECWYQQMKNTEIDWLKAKNEQLRSALSSAQAALNPASGFLKRGNTKSKRYLEGVRDKIRAALQTKAAGD
jgi:predicted NBD/HSP70 family sugar kinase